MADDQPPLRARPWKRPPDAGRSSAPYSSYRFIFRLLGIPVLAVCGLFLYNGIHDRFFLPACDSSTAKRSLADVLKQLKL